MLLLVWRKFWVLSWSAFSRFDAGFKVGWYCLVHYWISLQAASACFKQSAFNIWIQCSFIHQLFNTEFWLMDLMDWKSHCVFNHQVLTTHKGPRFGVYNVVYDSIVSILNFETRCSSSAASQVLLGPDSAVLLQWFLLKIRFVRTLDTIVFWGALLWLFFSALQVVELTLQASFVCPFVVIVTHWPFRLGTTIVVACAWSSSTYPRRRIPTFSQMVINLVFVWFFHPPYESIAQLDSPNELLHAIMSRVILDHPENIISREEKSQWKKKVNSA